MISMTPWKNTWRVWVKAMIGHISALKINLFIIPFSHYLFHFFPSSTIQEQEYQEIFLIGFTGSLISLSWACVQS